MQQATAKRGYPCSMFVTPPPGAPPLRDYICSICMDILRDPLQVCSEHHSYCRSCITEWRSTKDTCPECRKPSSREEPDRKVKNNILLLEVRCPHGGANSGGGGSSSSNSNIAADAEDEHQQKKRKQDHGAAPSSVPAATSCAWTGLLGEYEAHLAECPFVEVSCPFAEAGCGVRAARRDMGAHSSDMGAHFLMTMTTVAAVKAESAAVKAENEAMKSTVASLQEDSRLLKVCVSILQAPVGEEAAGDMEWVTRNFPAAGVYPAYTYTGQIRGGERHGFGGMSWETGTWKSYDGQWKDNKIHGQGIMEYRNGDVYEGQFADRLKQGQGMYKWSDRRSFVGQWQEGKMHGLGVLKYSNGDSEEGSWEESKRQGEFIWSNADGTRYSHVYKDDIATSQTPIP